MALLEDTEHQQSLQSPTHTTRQCSGLGLTEAQLSKILLLDHIKVNTNTQEPGPAEIKFWLLTTAAEEQKEPCSGKRISA